MRTEHFNIGETESYERRMERHAYETFRHSEACTNACRACKEHKKYRHHRVAPCVEWITAPITITHCKAEGKRVELLLRLRWKPHINGEDKPYHLVKNTYLRDIKGPKGGNRRDQEQVPWKRQRQSGGGRLMTTYEHQENQIFDLRIALDENIGKLMEVKVKPGFMDITNWRQMRHQFGQSYIKIVNLMEKRR